MQQKRTKSKIIIDDKLPKELEVFTIVKINADRNVITIFFKLFILFPFLLLIID